MSGRQIALTVALLAACKEQKSRPPEPVDLPVAAVPVGVAPKLGEPVARATMERALNESMYLVALPDGANVDLFEKLARKRGPTLAITRELTESIDPIVVDMMTRHLEPAEAAKANAATDIITILAEGSNAESLARASAGVALDVAEASKGWIFDLQLASAFTAADFRERVAGEKLDARKLVQVHVVSGKNSAPFLVTAGLRRYGFHELYFPQASPGHADQLTHLMSGAAQMILDKRDVNDRGEIAIDFHALGWDVGIIEKGTGKATWKTRWAKEDPTDEDMVVELVPPKAQGAEGAAMMIDACFGFLPDDIVESAEDDPELLAAAEKARADLVKLRPHFANGIPPGEELLVKAKFSTDAGEVEWMWMNVVSYRGTTLEGMLANDPRVVTTLRDGSKVKVKFADVADYLYEKDGESKGGYSIEVFNQRDGKKR
jgi:uncharacterized protein YegJ (DUF2314 family)